MAKLSTPQNVSVTDNQLSFSEVANAQWYSILANGNEIGTYGNVVPETTNAYRVVVSKPEGVTLDVTVNDKPNDPDAGIEYPVQSGWALYDGDQLSIYKMGSNQYLTINGVYYPANNTKQTITVTDDDVIVGLDGMGDAGGDNYAEVIVNFVQSTPYGTSKLCLGSNRIVNLYNGTLPIRSAYLGTTKVFGLTEVYKIQSLLTNVIYCNEFGVPVDPPTETATGGAYIYYIKHPDHYNLTTLTVTPNGVAKSLMVFTSENITTINYSDPRGPFTIEAVAEKVSYPITKNLTNCQITSLSPADRIEYGGTVEYTIDPVNEFFELPKTVTVTGATGNWDAENGFLTISNPTGPVTVTVTCVTAAIQVTYNLTHCTAASTNPTSVFNSAITDFKFVADTGYVLGATPTVENGVLLDWSQPDINDPTTWVATIANAQAGLKITVVGSLPKLDAPTNLAVSDNTLTFDEVANAEQYEVFAGSNSIGTTDGGVTPKGYKLTLTSIHLNAGQTASIHMNNADGTSTVVSTLSNNMSWENVVSFYVTDSYAYGAIIARAADGSVVRPVSDIYTLTQNTTLTYDNSCLTADMMVTLADGSEKQICDLTSDDTYVAYDLATGDLVTAPAKYFDAVNGHSGKFAGQYQKYTFEDGTVIKEVHKHRFLNLTRMEFIYLCHWSIGDRIYKMDGTTPALVSREIVTGTVEHFTVTTEKYHNGFVQGCLYGDRYAQRYEIQMVDCKPKYDFNKPHIVDYLYGKLSYDD